MKRAPKGRARIKIDRREIADGRSGAIGLTTVSTTKLKAGKHMVIATCSTTGRTGNLTATVKKQSR